MLWLRDLNVRISGLVSEQVERIGTHRFVGEEVDEASQAIANHYTRHSIVRELAQL